ncbi:MAG: NAD(P)H-dependent oxidoreductase [Planctomycetota bacterium]
MTIKITAICGSVRPENATSRALALALDELATHPDVEVTPIYLEELDLSLPGLPPGNPEALERFQKTVEDSTGVFLASPEYHGGVSSPMKLAIDNLGFPSKLAGKPVGLLGVAAGRIGAIKSLEQLRGICAHVGALVLPGSVSVAQVHQAFDEEGRCLDEEVEKQVRGGATALVDYIRSAIGPRAHRDAEGRDRGEPEAPGQQPRTRRRNTHASFRDARAEFELAWNQPGHTRIEPDAVDVNQLLEHSSGLEHGFRLTGQMLWDAEVAKAWDPGTYISGVVLAGESWGRKTLPDGKPWFVRSSQQVAWKSGADAGVVLEEVYLDPSGRSVLFFGRSELIGPDGVPLEGGAHQPLFHVEHAVTGTEEQPLNRWRIVHLTEAEDPALVERQVQEGPSGWLLGFLSKFIELDLKRRPLVAQRHVG